MQLIKNKKILLALGAVFLVTLAIVFWLHSGKIGPSPTPRPSGASYKNLTPGTSSEKDVKGALGTPLKETASGEQTVLEYKSKNPNFNDEFALKAGTLAFVRQIVTLDDNLKIPDLEKKYGKYESVLYGNLSTSGFNLYVYPDKGVAYIGQPESGFITEIWYFVPTDLNTFKQLFASGFSDTLVPRQ